MLFDRCLSGSCSSTSRDIVVSGTGSGSAATGARKAKVGAQAEQIRHAGAGAGEEAAAVLGGGTSGGASRTGGASEDDPQPMANRRDAGSTSISSLKFAGGPCDWSGTPRGVPYRAICSHCRPACTKFSEASTHT